MPESTTPEPVTFQDESSLFSGMLVCWLLNVTQLGIACLLFAFGERTLPTVVVLVGAIGLLQVGYIAPLWYMFRRRGAKKMAKGMALGAVFTLLLNAVFWVVIYANG